ncbi:unnamed protein product [Mesocestoides corti]|uniref:Abdominal-A n=1 Tax=Mesocestoides corti TaxID=53468 RepID=A0A0R3UGV4_MESCO|nr:unnamed protein product [Mesocestoides corti]
MPWPTDPRFASYFLPGYPAAIAAVMAAMRSSSSPVYSPSAGGVGDYSPGTTGGFLSGLASSSASPAAVAPSHSNSAFYTPPWESHGAVASNTSVFGSPTGNAGSGDGHSANGGESQRSTSVDDSSQVVFVS